MSPWDRLLARPHCGGHYVQLYAADEHALASNVGHYVWEGMQRGEGALIIATREHEKLFSDRLKDLGANLPALLSSRQLNFRNAHETLTRFMVDGQPDWHLFEKVIRAVMREVRPAAHAEGLRAYGEMVGILWKARQFSAAIRLEQLWNKLLERSSFSLYCAYAIDIFGEEFEVANLDSVLCAHTHLVPGKTNGSLDAALNRAMDEVLGPNAGELRIRIKNNYHPAWAVMPAAVNTVLWLRKNLPEQAGHIVARARDHYRQMHHAAG